MRFAEIPVYHKLREHGLLAGAATSYVDNYYHVQHLASHWSLRPSDLPRQAGCHKQGILSEVA